MLLAQRLNLDKDPIFLIDGTSFLYRGFYAYPDLKRSDGFPTNALFIVLRMLLRLRREERPAYAGFFMDGPGPTFRHKRFPAYKAQRLKAPEDLIKQIAPLLQGVDLLGLTTVVSEGTEADDLIASACARFKRERPVVIVGSDKDLLQCLDSNVAIWDPGHKNEKLITLESFDQTFRMRPEQWPDYQALVGDSSDNIPGIPGIGPKTAQALMQRFPGLEDLQDGMARLSPKELKKISPNLENIFLYRELTRLRTDLDAATDLSAYRCRPMQAEALRQFFQEYEFRSLVREVLPDSKPAITQSPRIVADNPALEAQKTSPSPAIPRIPLSELPDFSGKRVAIWPEAKEWRLAFDNAERSWSATKDQTMAAATKALAGALCRADLVIALSWKDLLHSNPAWAEVGMDHRFDVSLAAYLLQPAERDYGLDSLARAFQHELPDIPNRSDSDLPALLLLSLGAILEQKTNQTGFRNLLTSLEMPLIPVLVDMEQAGIMLDQHALNAFLDEVRINLKRASQAVFDHAGKPFNLRSSQQLAEVLFECLGLKTGRKTPGGGRSTNNEVLEKLASAHPIVPKILEYRKLEKLRSTYLEPLPKLTDAAGRLHTTFNQLATATGRLSSSNPNLQNIPIRGLHGRRMRACFTAPHGHHLVSADYSQIELRILAHLSEDPHLLKLFAQGTDIHAGTAAILFAKEPGQVTTDERRKAKTINFGLLYGMGPQKLGRELNISLREAKDFIALYFSRLAKVREFYDRVVDEAKQQGAVFTLAGRRRILPDIHSRNENLVQAARRMAINTVVQGSAADVIKMAMIRVHQDQVLRNLQACMILQVHDELVLEAPEQTAEQVGARVEELMSSVTKLKVPLAVDWGAGANWALAHE
ncbi:MAG TPA: DNA polymerase I [Desulfonatronum sp.]|nr:DNA polymerase I [Desulfonatronum sp.]